MHIQSIGPDQRSSKVLRNNQTVTGAESGCQQFVAHG